MGRKRKNNVIQEEMKLEVPMTDDIIKTPSEDHQENLEAIQKEIDLARLELENTKKEIEEKKHELKIIPNREIDAYEKKLVEKQVSMSNEKSTLAATIEKQRIYDSELVTGRFMNRRSPGQSVKLPYMKHSTDNPKWYSFEDGKVYTIPRGFKDQLNGGTDDDPCYYTPQFIQKEGIMDPNQPSSAIHSIDSSNKKYAFVPIGF